MTDVNDMCINCTDEAVWIRSTQFAGDHPFCDKHAKEEENFGVDDSYQYWYRLEDEVREKEVFDPANAVIDDMGIVHVDTSSKVEAHEVNDKLDAIKRKIEPFLDNLARNPDQDIHWPQRDVKIRQFKRELWDIIDG